MNPHFIRAHWQELSYLWLAGQLRGEQQQQRGRRDQQTQPPPESETDLTEWATTCITTLKPTKG